MPTAMAVEKILPRISDDFLPSPLCLFYLFILMQKWEWVQPQYWGKWVKTNDIKRQNQYDFEVCLEQNF